ncbi:hypothetical protein EVAR_94458_1 [Eumeta japonica]|uniref:Uncharacterized protein n=1 Tax=Eumeta variegata TaxID=151549 RepID=A0A4C1ZRP0_EUMVA|nr:hypothetical protein EVAR_94458_1 [Eumeta japonica]
MPLNPAALVAEAARAARSSTTAFIWMLEKFQHFMTTAIYKTICGGNTYPYRSVWVRVKIFSFASFLKKSVLPRNSIIDVCSGKNINTVVTANDASNERKTARYISGVHAHDSTSRLRMIPSASVFLAGPGSFYEARIAAKGTR